MEIKTRIRVLGIVLIVAVLALTFVWINSSGTFGGVPGQTNDEMRFEPA